MSAREREKIFVAAELVQKNYLELRSSQEVSLEKLIDVFIERGGQSIKISNGEVSLTRETTIGTS